MSYTSVLIYIYEWSQAHSRDKSAVCPGTGKARHERAEISARTGWDPEHLHAQLMRRLQK